MTPIEPVDSRALRRAALWALPAVVLFAASGWALGRQAAFGPRVPGAADTLVALPVTAAAAMAAALLAGRSPRRAAGIRRRSTSWNRPPPEPRPRHHG